MKQAMQKTALKVSQKCVDFSTSTRLSRLMGKQRILDITTRAAVKACRAVHSWLHGDTRLNDCWPLLTAVTLDRPTVQYIVWPQCSAVPRPTYSQWSFDLQQLHVIYDDHDDDHDHYRALHLHWRRHMRRGTHLLTYIAGACHSHSLIATVYAQCRPACHLSYFTTIYKYISTSDAIYFASVRYIQISSLCRMRV